MSESHLIMIVDDTDVHRMISKKIIQVLGHETCEAASGVEAIALLKEQPVAMIFMDIEMPGDNGIVTCQKIRKEGLTRCPIIAVTGHKDDDIIARSKEAGMNGCMTKPVTQQNIEKMIRRHLG